MNARLEDARHAAMVTAMAATTSQLESDDPPNIVRGSE